MPRYYKVPYQGTVTNAGGDNDLLIVLPADDKPCRLAGWCIGQISEVQDAAEEGIRITVRHMTATVTDGNGTGVTPVIYGATGDAAAGFTAECNATTVATTSGTSTVVEELAWLNRNTPWEKWWDEPWQVKARQGEAFIVRMETTIADDMTFVGTFYIIED
jgi:hypothetical protein